MTKDDATVCWRPAKFALGWVSFASVVSSITLCRCTGDRHGWHYEGVYCNHRRSIW